MTRVPGASRGDTLCTYEGCVEWQWAWGLCPTHYYEVLGDPYANVDMEAQRAFVLARIERAGECWVWALAKGVQGYGQMGQRFPFYETRAHRFSYRVFVGPIPDGHDVHHRCGVRPCVNPEHLIAMSHDGHARHHGGNKAREVTVRMSFVRWDHDEEMEEPFSA